jgi:toxin YoeB
MNILFTKDTWKEYQNHQSVDQKAIDTLIKEIQRTPYQGSGNPEALKHDLSRYWSRRITQKHRLVYQIIKIGTSETVYIASCFGHY